MSTSSTERKAKGKRSAEESKWGEYLRRIKALPFVDKGNRPSWWAVPKRSGYPAPEMPYLRADHNLDDAGMLPDIALGMLCRPLLSAELADAARMERWLLQYCREQETHVVKRKHALRYGPLRDKDALVKAVVNLASLNRAR